MKQTFSKLAIVMSLFLFQIPYSYCQEKPKEKPKKEATDNDNDLDDDNTPPEDVPAKKAKSLYPRIVLGLEAGGGVSMLDMNGVSSTVTIGGTIGGFADIRMAGKFYVQPGIFYIMNGGSDVVLYNERSGHPLEINMIEIPVTIAFKTGKQGDRIRFTAGVTGYYGYNVSADLNGLSLSRGNSTNDDIKAAEIGLGANIGLELRNGMFFRIKSQAGLTDLRPSGNGPSIYTESDVITIGYLFHKKVRHTKPTPNSGEGYIEGRM